MEQVTKSELLTKPVCIYHANCLDGFASAWAVQRRFQYDATYIPASYGQEPPYSEIIGRDVFIVDFSYSLEQLHTMSRIANSVAVLDHHEKVQNALSNLPTLLPLKDWLEAIKYKSGLLAAHFDMEKSGCGITWNWMFPSPSMSSDIIQYIQDRDLWKFEYGDATRDFCAAMQAQDFNFALWNEIHDNLLTYELIKSGKMVRAQQYKMIKKATAAENGTRITFNGQHKAMVFHIPGWTDIVSEALNDYLEKHPDEEFVGSYERNPPQGYIFNFSLRSRKGGFNVNKLANTFGGGGHQSAAGFRIMEKDVEQFLIQGD